MSSYDLSLIFLAYRHVKALESRSQLLDAALASADEANRRWEDCRALVDQLRIENAALRVAINQLQQQAQASGGAVTVPIPPEHKHSLRPQSAQRHPRQSHPADCVIFHSTVKS